jgi:hypothetical protein
MHDVPGKDLHRFEEQKNQHRAAGVKEVLPALPEAHSAQRTEVSFGFLTGFNF